MIATIQRWLFGDRSKLARRPNCSRVGPSSVPAQIEPDFCRPDSAEAWLARTLEHSRRLSPSKDGRLRLRGEDRLDICASPELVPIAISAFAGWIESLQRVGIAVEMRSPEGWRVCAVRDGVALVIRVRERLERVAVLDGASRAVERLLSREEESALVPSQRLDLQVMRYGVSVASIAYQPDDAAECYWQALRAMRHHWDREHRYQQKLRHLAEARSVPAKPQPNMLPKAFRHEVLMTAEGGLPASVVQPAWPSYVGGSDSHSRVLKAFQQLERALVTTDPKLMQRERMTASLVGLSANCDTQCADTPSTLFGLPRGSGRAISKSSRRGPQVRVVA